MATVTDSPLDKKVEMTHWEKVCLFVLPTIEGHPTYCDIIANSLDLG